MVEGGRGSGREIGELNSSGAAYGYQEPEERPKRPRRAGRVEGSGSGRERMGSRRGASKRRWRGAGR